eukprot:964170_1
MKLIRIMRQRDENGKDEEDAHGVDYDTNIDVWHTQRRYRRGSLDVIHCYLCHTKWKKTNDASMIEMQKMNPKVNNSDKFVTNVMNSSDGENRYEFSIDHDYMHSFKSTNTSACEARLCTMNRFPWEHLKRH